ncbi:MAG: CvpA family protein [Desulfovibrio sp.]|nr:CvpA family protein [Desulfovibrio sp.]
MGSDIFDLILILLLVAFALHGLKNGFIAEIAGIVALVGGFFAANTLHPILSPYMEFITNPSLRTIVTYVLIFMSFMLLISLIVRVLNKFISLTFTTWINKLAGFIFGLAKGFLVCSLLILAAKAVFADADFIKNAHTVPYLQALLDQIREWMPNDLTSRLGLSS